MPRDTAAPGLPNMKTSDKATPKAAKVKLGQQTNGRYRLEAAAREP